MNINQTFRFLRIVRLYKLIRFFRLTKLLRLFKKRKINKGLGSMLKISAGYERFWFFAMFIALFIHIVSCFWVLITTYEKERNWLKNEIAQALDNHEEIKSIWE